MLAKQNNPIIASINSHFVGADFSKWFSSFVTGLFVGTQGANLVHYLADKKEDEQHAVNYPGAGAGYNNPYLNNYDNEGGGGAFFKLPFLGSSFWKLWGFSKNPNSYFKKKKVFNQLASNVYGKRVSDEKNLVVEGKGGEDGVELAKVYTNEVTSVGDTVGDSGHQPATTTPYYGNLSSTQVPDKLN